MATTSLNVHQRKLAVMKRCSAITADSKYNGMTKDGKPIRFEYLSVQAVSNHVRGFCVEEGLDVVPSITDGTVVLELVNVDEPADKIVATWPVVPNDKAWAYSVKYAIIRTFLIGDGEEGDEAEMASHSEQGATTQRSNGRKADTKPPEPPAEPAPAPSTITPGEREELYAITDKLGKERATVDGLLKVYPYVSVLERAQKELAAKEGTLPLVPVEEPAS